MEYLQKNSTAHAIDKKKQLISILGEETIGYWAIMDQILFYEELIGELST
jgi:hypothetical protein